MTKFRSTRTLSLVLISRSHVVLSLMRRISEDSLVLNGPTYSTRSHHCQPRASQPAFHRGLPVAFCVNTTTTAAPVAYHAIVDTSVWKFSVPSSHRPPSDATVPAAPSRDKMCARALALHDAERLPTAETCPINTLAGHRELGGWAEDA